MKLGPEKNSIPLMPVNIKGTVIIWWLAIVCKRWICYGFRAKSDKNQRVAMKITGGHRGACVKKNT